MLPILRAVCPQLLVRVYLMKGARQFSSATLYVVKTGKRHIQIIDMSVQESHPIDTTCGDLIEPAKQISDACRMGNRYTYGYVSRSIVDGSQTYPYLVAIGDDYAFEP
ncbi:hypothetical protein CNMCM5793_005495 [Aspergillus hiratsukae]|uniref:Uncharacterized protein n=1 Tax=Aspergillus hiratsukae TaxID=1194566 RepID=A0A8H6PGF4_9EURO|nr:hypothetical protein CNMCM5793_005495 [Aspergillus hiratsukae]KAF7174654.1 hypothetical protein CNMCM6106_000709 [Aspergillus hiratsukae]